MVKKMSDKAIVIRLHRLADSLDRAVMQGENTEKTYRTIIVTEPLIVEIKETLREAALKIEKEHGQEK